MTKKCCLCAKTLPFADFYPHRKNKDGLQTKCKVCEHSYHIKKKYNITRDQYLNMLQTAGQKCELCGKRYSKAQSLHIDHNHKTGKVRGILCSGCNHALSLLDNETLYAAALIYKSTRD